MPKKLIYAASELNILTEKDSVKMETICVYAGRFQPFTPAHYAVYKKAVTKFGADNVFIITSDNQSKDQSPFNFKEKSEIINKLYNIPKSNILFSASVYKVRQVMNKLFDQNSTVLYYVNTGKDDRMSKYDDADGSIQPFAKKAYVFQVAMVPLKYNGAQISGTLVRELFSATDTTVQQKKSSFKQLYGKYDQTVFDLYMQRLNPVVNQSAGSSYQTKAIENINKGYFPVSQMLYNYAIVPKVVTLLHWFDFSNLDNLIGLIGKDKAISTTSNITEFTHRQPLVAIVTGNILLYGKNDLYTVVDEHDRRYVKYINRFLGRRLSKQWTADVKSFLKAAQTQLDEAVFVQKYFKWYGEWIKENKQKIPVFKIKHLMKDPFIGFNEIVMDHINIEEICYNPFTQGRPLYDLKATIKTTEQTCRQHSIKFCTLPSKNASGQLKPKILAYNKSKMHESVAAVSQSTVLNQKSLLLCGGGAGHMAHPFQDNNLTFGDMKQLVDLVLSGRINVNSYVTMKLDGQNLLVSWKNGHLIAARNTGHLKNFGQTALDIAGMQKQFEGRGTVKDAFVFAMTDLQKAFKSLSEKTLVEIFNEGHKWVNLQIIYDKTRNVIPYDTSMLVFHGIKTIDQTGKTVANDVRQTKTIYQALVGINATIQKNFTIKPPAVVQIPRSKDFTAKKAYFIAKISKLQNQYSLSDESTLLDYHKAVWKKFILQQADEYNYIIEDSVLNGLVTRWSGVNKSYSMAKFKADCDNAQFQKFVVKFDKEDHQKVFAQNAFDWQVIFLQLGTEVLKNLSDYLLANPINATKTLRSELEDTIKQIQNSKDLNAISKLERPLKRLQAIGGPDAIVPTEGIVFEYGGKPYKLTGAFADVNRILGMIKYSR